MLSLRRKLQTNLTTNRNEMNGTRFTWKTLISGKNQQTEMKWMAQDLRGKTLISGKNHGTEYFTMREDKIQSWNDRTWSGMGVYWNHDFSQAHQTLARRYLSPLKLPKLLYFLLYSSVLHPSLLLSLSFWVLSLTQPLLCYSHSVVLYVTLLTQQLLLLLYLTLFL